MSNKFAAPRARRLRLLIFSPTGPTFRSQGFIPAPFVAMARLRLLGLSSQPLALCGHVTLFHLYFSSMRPFRVNIPPPLVPLTEKSGIRDGNPRSFAFLITYVQYW